MAAQALATQADIRAHIEFAWNRLPHQIAPAFGCLAVLLLMPEMIARRRRPLIMNKRWVTFHLQEAEKELRKLAEALQSSAVSEEEFEIGIERAYHHINVAWNSRAISDEEAAQHNDSDFVEWRKFPKNLNL
jgi:hypothetical protein